jgi:hypothetical protein
MDMHSSRVISIILPEGYRSAEEFCDDCGVQLVRSEAEEGSMSYGQIPHAGPDASMVYEMERIRRIAAAVADMLIAKGEKPARPTPGDSSPVVTATRKELIAEIVYHFGLGGVGSS